MSAAKTSLAPVVAILPWGDVIEDYLDSIGVTRDEFCQEMTGGWLFNYVDALKRSGVRSAIYCITARPSTRKTTCLIHRPTGAEIVFLPVPRAYQMARRMLPNPYAWTI